MIARRFTAPGNIGVRKLIAVNDLKAATYSKDEDFLMLLF